MGTSKEFAEYFILSLGIILFIGLPICALTSCLCCKKHREHMYLEIP